MSETFDNPHVVITAPDAAGIFVEKISARPTPDEVLIKTLYSLISPGTELAMFQHTHVGFTDPSNSFAKYPFRAGYSAVGRIEAVGSSVSTFRKDTLVFIKGRHQAYFCVNPNRAMILTLPSGIDPKLALFARIAQIAGSALEVSFAEAGDKVVSLGQGIVGILAAQLFQNYGCDVLSLGRTPYRSNVAKNCGLQSLCITEGDIVVQIRRSFAENGATTVVEATGQPESLSLALRMTAPGGETILLGSTRGRVDLDVYNLIHASGITLRGAHERVFSLFGDSNRAQILVKENLDAIVSGRLKVSPLLSVVMDYREIAAAYRRLADKLAETLSIVLVWPE
jgi:threonine dehydrogenase-like Zn-dependent dehydrogenase